MLLMVAPHSLNVKCNTLITFNRFQLQKLNAGLQVN